MLLSVFYWIFMSKREQMNQQQYLLTEQYRLDRCGGQILNLCSDTNVSKGHKIFNVAGR